MSTDDTSHLTEPYLIVENTIGGRFELHRGGDVVSVAEYTERDGVVVVPHVGTRPEHRGQGNAGRLMDGLLLQLRESGRTITPLCPFAASHISENPHWQDLLSSGRSR